MFFLISTTFGAAEDGGFMGVIPGAFLRVGQDFVGGLDFGESNRGFFFCTVVAIGMKVEGATAVGFFDSTYPVRKCT